MSKTQAFNKLLQYRENIEDILVQIDAILQTDFPDEYSVAYEHWMPQIKTALKDNTRWLPRGQYSMDYTVNRILDKITADFGLGVTKYIK